MVTVTVLGNNLFTVVLAISVGVVPRFARVTRGTILSIREREYVEAARALGASAARIIWSHVLLNAVDPLIVLCTLLIPGAIVTEALLSFLGLGIAEPNPTWGNMIQGGQIVMREAPWLTFFPGGHRVHGPGLQPARRCDSRRARPVGARGRRRAVALEDADVAVLDPECHPEEERRRIRVERDRGRILRRLR